MASGGRAQTAAAARSGCRSGVASGAAVACAEPPRPRAALPAQHAGLSDRGANGRPAHRGPALAAVGGDTAPLLRDRAPSQDDTIEVLRLLMRHQLLSFEQAPDLGTLQVGALTVGQPPAAPDPLSGAAPNTLWHWRIPLGDPSAWLNRHTWLADLAFSPMGLAVWVCLVASMLAGWLLHGAALLAHASVWMATPSHLLLSVLLYPVIKGCTRRHTPWPSDAGVARFSPAASR